MSNYKKVENLLYNYKMLKISIENKQQEIEYLKEEDGLSGISYDDISTSPTNKFSSSTEDTALSNTEKIHYLEHSIEGIRRQIESIDRAMEGLTDTERIVIQEKYINSKQWWQVSSVVHLGERQCRNIRKAAIEKMIIGMYDNIK